MTQTPTAGALAGKTTTEMRDRKRERERLRRRVWQSGVLNGGDWIRQKLVVAFRSHRSRSHALTYASSDEKSATADSTCPSFHPRPIRTSIPRAHSSALVPCIAGCAYAENALVALGSVPAGRCYPALPPTEFPSSPFAAILRIDPISLSG